MTSHTEEALAEAVVTRAAPEEVREVFSAATCLYTKSEVEAALDSMATEISYKLSHKDPIFLCVVVGGIVALGNLLPRLNFPLEADYVHATRYRGATRGRDLQWRAKPSCDFKGRTVVIVDDILDGGITMGDIVSYCNVQGAEAVYTAVLVNKKREREPGGWQKADFVGLDVENDYVFGFGLDYKEYLRNAPGIYKIAKKHE